jgi:hypothetical protein
MAFLRRLFGGGEPTDEPTDEPAATAPVDSAELDAAERERELEVLRAEQERLDELTQRQLRYEKYAWKPPAQGGERRAEDKDEPAER